MSYKISKEVKDPMFQEVEDLVNKGDPFLYVVPAPTGSGKSYSAIQIAINTVDFSRIRRDGVFSSVHEFVSEFLEYDNNQGPLKVFFLSTQHKLLPEEDMVKYLNERIAQLPKDFPALEPEDIFVKIPGNRDAVRNFLDRYQNFDCDKLSAFKNKELKRSWDDLYRCITRYKNRPKDPDVQKDLDMADRAFRSILGNSIREDVKKLPIPGGEETLRLAFPEWEEISETDLNQSEALLSEREIDKLKIQQFMAAILFDINKDCLLHKPNIKQVCIFQDVPHHRVGYEFAQKWAFVRYLYPSVLYERRPIVLMTNLKFQYRGADLYRTRKTYREDAALKHALIFMDESDAIKMNELKHMFEEAANHSTDLKSLADTILAGLRKPNFLEWINHSDPKQRKILEQMKSIPEKYAEDFDRLGLNHHFKKEQITSQYLFSMGTQTSLGYSHKWKYIYSEKNRTNTIYSYDALESEKKALKQKLNKTPGDHVRLEEIENALDLDKALQKEERFIGSFIGKCKKLAKSRAEKDGERSEQDQLNSIYDEVTFADAEKVDVLNNHTYHRIKSRQKWEEDDFEQIYTRGISVAVLQDKPQTHLQRTDLKYFGFVSSPENELEELVENGAKVVLMSATGDFNSHLMNYDLPYLKNVLGSKYKTISDLKRQQYEQYYKNNHQKGYENLDLVSYPLRSNMAPDQLKDRSALQKRLKQELGNIPKELQKDNKYALGKPYLLQQWLEIVLAIKAYLTEGSWAGLLMLNYNLKDKDSTVSVADFESIFKRLCNKYLSKDDRNNYTICVLNNDDGRDFLEEKKKAAATLKSGKHVLMATCYNTAGLGQNFDYPLNKKIADQTGVIYTGSLNRHETYEDSVKVDIDYLYLQRRKTIRASSKDFEYNGCQKDGELLLKCLLEIRLDNLNGELSFEDMSEKMNSLVSALSAGNRKLMNSTLEYFKSLSTTSIAALASYYQAIGRMLRNDAKRPRIRITYGEDILDPKHIPPTDPTVFTNDSISVFPKEFLVFLESIENEGQINGLADLAAEKENLRIGNNARQITKHSNSLLTKAMSGNADSEIYRDRREKRILFFLRHPGGSLEELKKAAREEGGEVMSEGQIETYYVPADKKHRYYGTDARNHHFFVGESRKSVEDQLNKWIKNETADSTALPTIAIVPLDGKGSHLDFYMKNQLIRRYMEEKGYPTSLEGCEYILNPAPFNDSYKGALGEIAGVCILAKEIGLNFKKMPTSIYERFDAMDESGMIFFDFKNYGQSNWGAIKKETPNERYYRKLHECATGLGKEEKQTYLGVICNTTYKSDSVVTVSRFGDMPETIRSKFGDYLSDESKLIFIPSLLTKDAEVNEEQLNKLKKIIEGALENAKKE